MTISDAFEVALAPDLFQQNECVNLRWSGSEPRPDLAAVTFMRSADVRDVRADLIWECVREACSLIARDLPSYTPWICVSTTSGASTRVTRHNALWRALAARSFKPTARHTLETSQEKGDGSLCFYGAAELEREKVEELRMIVTRASRSFLCWMPSATAPDIDQMVTAGWNRGLSDFRELANVAHVIAAQGGIVLRLFGEFDDRENGVDCIMNTKNYALLSSLVD